MSPERTIAYRRVIQTLAELGPMQFDDPALEKYKDQIEKDLANFE